MESEEEWQGNGEINRDGAWMFYAFMNALAIYFNLSLIISVQRLKARRTSTDILIAGLSSGVVLAASGCGPQCFINLVKGTFAYGNGACFAEAFLHLIGMEIQFLSVAAIAHRTYIGVKLQVYSVDRAYWTIILIWSISIGATLGVGSVSSYYLVQSGTFCFYKWTSPVLIFLAWPMAGIAALCMIYWYWYSFKIFKHLREREATSSFHTDSHRNVDKDLSVRLFILVFLFVFGYIGIIGQSIYEITVGRAAAWSDVFAATLVLVYWVSVAFAYAHANKRLGILAVLICKPSSSPQVQTITPESIGLPSLQTRIPTPTRLGTGESATTLNPITEIEKKKHPWLPLLFQKGVPASESSTPINDYRVLKHMPELNDKMEMIDFLATKTGNQAFYTFLQDEHSVENLEFYNAIIQLNQRIERSQTLTRSSVETKSTSIPHSTSFPHSNSTTALTTMTTESMDLSYHEARSRTELLTLVKKIYLTFMDENSPKVITVSFEVKEKLQADLAKLLEDDEKGGEGGAGGEIDEEEKTSLTLESIRSLYHESFVEITRLMEADSFQRFMLTPTYQSLTGKS